MSIIIISCQRIISNVNNSCSNGVKQIEYTSTIDENVGTISVAESNAMSIQIQIQHSTVNNIITPIYAQISSQVIVSAHRKGIACVLCQ